MPNGQCAERGRKRDPVWLSFARIPKGTGIRAKCRKGKQEIQGLVLRMRKEVETCQPTQINNPAQVGKVFSFS